MAAYWIMMISISGMYSLYIIHNGFTKLEISITVTVFTISALLGQNVLGYLADKIGHVRRILLSSISVGMAISIAMIFARQHWQISGLIFLWGFFIYGTVPLSEAWCIGILTKSNEQRNFGKIRGVGSIGYALAGILLGSILQKFGWNYYFWYILISIGFALVSIYIIHDDGRVELFKGKGEGGEERITFKEAFIEIKKIKALKSIIIIVFIYSFVVRGIYSYLGILVSDLGGGPLSLGFTYFFDAGPEIVTFFLAARLLARFKSKSLILVSFLLQILRLLLILVFNSSLAIILLGVLAGLSYGMLAASYKTYIYELAPEKYKISCLSLSESIIGLAGVISAPVFGFVIMKFSGNVAIAMGLVIYTGAAVFILRDLFKDRRMDSSAIHY